MTDDDWDAGFAKSLTVFLNGDAIAEPDKRGERIHDDSFLLMFNASEQDMKFVIPPRHYGELWAKVLDTAVPVSATAQPAKAGDKIAVPNRSTQVLRRA
jgi:isoamylase